MDRLSKRKALEKWLISNPGKTERDWLLEARCMNDIQREDLRRLFSWADTNSIIIKVCPTVGSFKDYRFSFQEVVNVINPHRRAILDEILEETEYHPQTYVEADFKIIGNKDLYYDLDAPDYVFEQPIPDLYLNWKAEQMGIDPSMTHTEYDIYEAFKPYMGANIPNWKNLITN